jgi:thiol:disulfide interchange protein
MKLKMFALTIICAVAICGCAECNTKNTAPDPKHAAGVKTEQGGVAWVYTLAEGLTIAKATKKPVMVDFFATWCGWCKKLDADVYTNAEVVELSKEFVCVKVDTDKFEKETTKYVIQGLPTVAFLNADGTIIDKLVGYTAAPAFSLKMKKMLKK